MENLEPVEIKIDHVDNFLWKTCHVDNRLQIMQNARIYARSLYAARI